VIGYLDGRGSESPGLRFFSGTIFSGSDGGKGGQKQHGKTKANQRQKTVWGMVVCKKGGGLAVAFFEKTVFHGGSFFAHTTNKKSKPQESGIRIFFMLRIVRLPGA